ncbi:MAG: cation:proton antiporter [Dehalococcoidia bacterium]|nr:cation:proton antiporter [Dehalococcoidia bacterium]
MTAIQILGFLGILLIIGFIGDYLFKKMHFPDILALLALGYVAGNVLHIVDPAWVAPASPIIANLSLVIIMFNGGLGLEFSQAQAQAPRAIALALVGIAASMASATAFVYYVLDWELMNSLLLGAIVGGTSPAIVMPLIGRAKVPAQISSLLHIESAINGALVIVIALVILEVMTVGATENVASAIAKAIGMRFLLGVGVGAVAGFAWLWVLTFIEGELYDDILTLAVLFLLCLAVESLGGSGAIFALVFGLILGNGMDFARFIRTRRTIEIHNTMMKFHSQISFIVKTLFFAYLGLMVTFDEPRIIVPSIILSLALLAARFIVVPAVSIGKRNLLAHTGILATMLPRGLSAAVVAEIAASSDISHARLYPEIVILVIATTVIISAVGIPIFARKAPRENREIGERSGISDSS